MKTSAFCFNFLNVTRNRNKYQMGLISRKLSNNASFSETIIRPMLKKSIKHIENSWQQASVQVRATILQLLVQNKLDVKSPTEQSAAPTANRKFVEQDHPILGTLICDLKYKKVYLSDINSLVKAHVWEKQRTLRHERAELIAHTKIENNSCNLMPGVITCYQVANTENIGKIIDDNLWNVSLLFV